MICYINKLIDRREGDIFYRHPCFWAFGFGEDIRGKPDARRSCLASSSFHIRQCAHIGPFRAVVLGSMLTQKSVEIVLLSVPRIEALALPIVVEQTTLEPTPIWIQYPLTHSTPYGNTTVKGMRLFTSRGRLPLLCPGQQFYRRYARCSIRPRSERL